MEPTATSAMRRRTVLGFIRPPAFLAYRGRAHGDGGLDRGAPRGRAGARTWVLSSPARPGTDRELAPAARSGTDASYDARWSVAGTASKDRRPSVPARVWLPHARWPEHRTFSVQTTSGVDE